MLAVAATVAFSAPAFAQYYAPQPGYPPPGYAQPGYPPPGYAPRPDYPPPYPRPEYRPEFGQRCLVEFTRPDGRPRRIVCPIIRAKPLGEDCACPPPPPPPGYPPGDYIPGRTVR